MVIARDRGLSELRFNTQVLLREQGEETMSLKEVKKEIPKTEADVRQLQETVRSILENVFRSWFSYHEYLPIAAYVERRPRNPARRKITYF